MTVHCLTFRACLHGRLRGFASFLLPDLGITIRDCPVYQRASCRGVGLPTKWIETERGGRRELLVVEFASEGQLRAFQVAALEALEQWDPSRSTRSTLTAHVQGELRECPSQS